MPELEDRREIEERLAEEIAAQLGISYTEALGLLGADFDITRLDETYWEKHQVAMAALLSVALADVFVRRMYQEEIQLFALLTPGTPEAQAIDWAGRHAGELVNLLDMTTRNDLQRVLGRAIEEGWDQQRLADSLAPVFGPNRAAMIARNEITRADMAGVEQYRREMERAGHTTVLVWEVHPEASQTGPCPICAPRDGKLQGDGWISPEPAHVNCVCTVRPLLQAEAIEVVLT